MGGVQNLVLYKAVQGFDAENLKVTFNDIDFCLKIGQLGKKILYSPVISFEHLESKSRGHDAMSEAKRIRAEKEAAFMTQKWSNILTNDPWYPKEFLRYSRPFAWLDIKKR